MTPLAICTFKSVTDRTPVQGHTSWEKLAARLTTHKERADKDGMLFSPTEYAPGATRGIAGVVSVCCFVADFDDGTAPGPFMPRWEARGLTFAVYSTHSHAPLYPKWRAVFPLARPVSAAEWEGVHRKLGADLCGGRTDPACKDASRIYYLPSCPPGAERFAYVHDGAWLDPDSIPDVGEPAATTPTTPKTAAHANGTGGQVKIPAAVYAANAEVISDFNARGTIEFALPDWPVVRARPDGELLLRRPGTDNQHSATFGCKGSRAFKCFTPNGSPFVENGTYSLFDVFCLAQHANDPVAAIQALISEGFGVGNIVSTSSGDDKHETSRKKSSPAKTFCAAPDDSGDSAPPDGTQVLAYLAVSSLRNMARNLDALGLRVEGMGVRFTNTAQSAWNLEKALTVVSNAEEETQAAVRFAYGDIWGRVEATVRNAQERARMVRGAFASIRNEAQADRWRERLNGYRRVCEAWPIERRKPGVPWWVYETAVGMNEEQQDYWRDRWLSRSFFSRAAMRAGTGSPWEQPADAAELAFDDEDEGADGDTNRAAERVRYRAEREVVDLLRLAEVVAQTRGLTLAEYLKAKIQPDADEMGAQGEAVPPPTPPLSIIDKGGTFSDPSVSAPCIEPAEPAELRENPQGGRPRENRTNNSTVSGRAQSVDALDRATKYESGNPHVTVSIGNDKPVGNMTGAAVPSARAFILAFLARSPEGAIAGAIIRAGIEQGYSPAAIGEAIDALVKAGEVRREASTETDGHPVYHLAARTGPVPNRATETPPLARAAVRAAEGPRGVSGPPGHSTREPARCAAR